MCAINMHFSSYIQITADAVIVIKTKNMYHRIYSCTSTVTYNSTPKMCFCLV